jgi:hypothetical protein
VQGAQSDQCAERADVDFRGFNTPRSHTRRKRGYFLTYLAVGTQIEEEDLDPPEEGDPFDEYNVHKFPCSDKRLSPLLVCDEPVIRLVEPVTLPFSHLHDVRLTKVKACPGQFFFHQLRHLERPELAFVPKFVLHSLMPCAGVTPCPKLTTLFVRDDRVDVAFIVGPLWDMRTMWGACEFQDVGVQVRRLVVGQSVDFPNPQKRAVRVIHQPIGDSAWDRLRNIDHSYGEEEEEEEEEEEAGSLYWGTIQPYNSFTS